MLEIFDAAEVTECYRRTETVVPQQALALANSELSVRCGRKLAGKLWEDACKTVPESETRNKTFIAAAFEQVLTRQPSAGEASTCLAFLKNQADVIRAAKSKADPDCRAREDLVHALLNHNDFVTIR
jgi:hypothetical protein